MINLLICYDTNTWESKVASIDRERCLTEYILPEIKQQFSALGEEEINQIKGFPCIFAYEQVHRKDAYIGYIRNVMIGQYSVIIDYELTGEKIKFDDFINLSRKLDLGTWELNRTHWTIKNIDLDKIIPFFDKNTEHKPCVFISYSWTPVENQKYVFDLVSRLNADGIKVIYDKKDLQLGQDKDYFMERALTNNEIDYVLVICNKDYSEKANNRHGGVGYESEIIISQLSSKPLQTRIIPVIIETNEKGDAYLPTFLKARLFVDLTKESGYQDLIAQIKS